MNTMFSILFTIAFSLEHKLLENVVATSHNAARVLEPRNVCT
jgi:hypothetical protein